MEIQSSNTRLKQNHCAFKGKNETFINAIGSTNVVNRMNKRRDAVSINYKKLK